ncbi:hypothetical protein E4K10_18040 [Streptomyces sp. T1317-0309]|nr:hypothetical protein E4K10_18040 [Streptomyces sp. T1317-0309]
MYPQVTTDNNAVRIPLSDRVEPIFDELAIAYAEYPEELGSMLKAHAANVLRHDHAVCSDTASDWAVQMMAARADGTRDALLTECPSALALDPLINADEAITLAGRLTNCAAHIRQHKNGPTSK